MSLLSASPISLSQNELQSQMINIEDFFEVVDIEEVLGIKKEGIYMHEKAETFNTKFLSRLGIESRSISTTSNPISQSISPNIEYDGNIIQKKKKTKPIESLPHYNINECSDEDRLWDTLTKQQLKTLRKAERKWKRIISNLKSRESILEFGEKIIRKDELYVLLKVRSLRGYNNKKDMFQALVEKEFKDSIDINDEDEEDDEEYFGNIDKYDESEELNTRASLIYEKEQKKKKEQKKNKEQNRDIYPIFKESTHSNIKDNTSHTLRKPKKRKVIRNTKPHAPNTMHNTSLVPDVVKSALLLKQRESWNKAEEKLKIFQKEEHNDLKYDFARTFTLQEIKLLLWARGGETTFCNKTKKILLKLFLKKHFIGISSKDIDSSSESEINVCTKCDKPHEGLMLLCEICNNWTHGKCIGISSRKFAETFDYKCKSCEQKLNKGSPGVLDKGEYILMNEFPQEGREKILQTLMESSYHIETARRKLLNSTKNTQSRAQRVAARRETRKIAIKKEIKVNTIRKELKGKSILTNRKNNKPKKEKEVVITNIHSQDDYKNNKNNVKNNKNTNGNENVKQPHSFIIETITNKIMEDKSEDATQTPPELLLKEEEKEEEEDEEDMSIQNNEEKTHSKYKIIKDNINTKKRKKEKESKINKKKKSSNKKRIVDDKDNDNNNNNNNNNTKVKVPRWQSRLKAH